MKVKIYCPQCGWDGLSTLSGEGTFGGECPQCNGELEMVVPSRTTTLKTQQGSEKLPEEKKKMKWIKTRTQGFVGEPYDDCLQGFDPEDCPTHAGQCENCPHCRHNGWTFSRPPGGYEGGYRTINEFVGGESL